MPRRSLPSPESCPPSSALPRGTRLAILLAAIATIATALGPPNRVEAAPGSRATGSRYAARWAAIAEAARHFADARVESLATSILTDVERDRPVDSMEYAHAWIDI